MNILIVAATQFELDSIWEIVEENRDHQFFFLKTGVGITATSYWLGRTLNSEFHDLAINIGLAGAFDRSLKLGEVVNVIEDQLSEEGAEDDSNFISLDELGLREETNFTVYDGKFKSTYELPNSKLKKVRGITVNTVHGNEASIQAIQSRLNPQVESMEGAAFLYACNSSKVPCLQIRSISNYVEKRNRANWKIELALNNLADAIQVILKQL